MTPKKPEESDLKDMEKGVLNTEISGEMKKEGLRRMKEFDYYIYIDCALYV